jgi:leader peptidase (prepilin peptidase)/N-methyltransferase
MMFLVYVFVAIFGLIVGSFLNAVIYRLEVSDSVVKGRSYCPHCKHTLAWHDLIPLLSFVILGGKCRYCGGRISWQYPFIEVSTALIFLAIFNFEFLISKQFSHSLIFETFYLFAIASLLIVLFVYDLKHYILPDKIVFPAIGLTLVYGVLSWIFSHWDLIRNLELEISHFGSLVNSFLAGMLAAAFFLSIFLLSRGRAMGFGDVKLALFMGLFLGWPAIAPALFIAFMLGGAVGIVLLAAGKKNMKSEVPFGPFLIAGTFAALYWGKLIVDWYWNLIY